MPTLVRLFAVLLVLGGLAFAGMLALTVFVNPTPKEVRVKIPTAELGVEQARNNDPLGIRPVTPAAEPAVTTTTAAERPVEPGTTEVDIPE